MINAGYLALKIAHQAADPQKLIFPTRFRFFFSRKQSTFIFPIYGSRPAGALAQVNPLRTVKAAMNDSGDPQIYDAVVRMSSFRMVVPLRFRDVRRFLCFVL